MTEHAHPAQTGRAFNPAEEYIDYVCPECGQGACETPSLGHEENVVHRFPVRYVREDVAYAEAFNAGRRQGYSDGFNEGQRGD